MRFAAAHRRRTLSLAGLALMTAAPTWAQMQRFPSAAKDGQRDTFEFAAAGDFYWHEGRRIELQRSTREIAVGFPADTPQARVEATVRALSRIDAGRARRTAPRGGKELWVFPLASGSAPSAFEQSLAAVRGQADVEYAYPVLFNPETQSRLMVTDDVVVKLKPGRSLADLASAMRSAGLVERRRIDYAADQFILRIERRHSTSALAAAQALQESGLVEWAQPDFVQQYRKTAVPNDTRFANQWHLHNTGQAGATVDADVDAPEAWDLHVGSPSIVIAVIDDGVEIGHEDLAPNAYTNTADPPGGGDNDGNGLIDDYRGWDFVSNDNDPNPADADDNHGTAVAGVAGARGNNALGVSGSCRECRVMGVRIGFGAYPDTHYAGAIAYAATRADVLNNSWGGGSPSAAIQSAIQTAITTGRGGRGSVVLFATGNSASGQVLDGVTGLPGGFTYRFRWEYVKDPSGSAGNDTTWMPWVFLTGAPIFTFEGGILPAGFSSGVAGPPGTSPWSVVTDPTHSDEGFCLSRAVRAGATANSGTSYLELVRTLPAAADLFFYRWVSSQAGDGLRILVDQGNNGSYELTGTIDSGVPNVVNGVSYPAAYPESIAVGASSDMDCRSDYSQFGPQVALVAPSNAGPINNAIETTDRTGTAGYEATAAPGGNYTQFLGLSGFGGTSSATPLASGVVGVMLSANPNLKVKNVRSMLKRSTDQVGPEPYVAGRNDRYGYGRLNARKAVAAALDFLFEDGFE
jgi:subtilisin family serine protease